MAGLTHSSFFTGAGGIDLGLSRAGWTTVTFSEIDDYACAILRERWPDVPNLGDVRTIEDPPTSVLWSAGFPCQDLAHLGPQKGLDGSRSGTVWAFLELVARGRPEAILFENVVGFLSSHRGRDFYTFADKLAKLRYGWAYRVLDSSLFGVPQHRRRVYVLALCLDRHPDQHSAAEVLAVGTRCPRDHAEELESSQSATRQARGIPAILRQAVTAKWASRGSGPSGDEHNNLVLTRSQAIDPPGGRTTSGMAGWAHVGCQLEDQAWTSHAGESSSSARVRETGDRQVDNRRYKVIGNGVSAPVAAWIGNRLKAHLDAAAR